MAGQKVSGGGQRNGNQVPKRSRKAKFSLLAQGWQRVKACRQVVYSPALYCYLTIFKTMLKNYFLTAFRSLKRNKSYSLLNILGLSLGVTCSILLFLAIKYELSYDTFHVKREQLYRVVTTTKYSEGSDQTTAVHFPTADYIRNNGNLGFTALTQMYGEEGAQINIPTGRQNQPRKFMEEGVVGFVEPSFFELFDFNKGGADPSASLAEPNNVILTEAIAEKYFPGEEAVGKVIRYNNKENLRVTGVIPNFPSNTDFPFVMLVSYPTYKKVSYWEAEGWGTLSSPQQLYVLKPEAMSVAEAEERLNGIIEANLPQRNGSRRASYNLQPFTDVHFNGELGNYANRTIQREVIWSMALVGLFLIVVACINFVNLATAQASKRAKEVGVRKVMGSSQQQLMLQFIGETFLITLLATLVSVILAELALPYLNDLLELQITFNLLQDPVLLLFLVAQVVLVTLFAGLYPAFIMSRFQPIEALKSRINTQRVAGLSLRRALVVVQFTICQVLIICTIIVSNQLEFFRSKPMGFTKEAVVTTFLPMQQGQKLMPYRQEMLQNPAVREVSFAGTPPAANMTWTNNFSFGNSSKDAPFQSNTKFADPHYFNLYDLELVAGRIYTSADSNAFLINETMRRKLGIKSAEAAIGQKVSLGGGDKMGTVVGVLKDFHQNSLHKPVDPSLVTQMPQAYMFLSAKIDMSQKQEALAHLEKVWGMAYPNDVFNYEFYDEEIERFYREEARQSKLFKVFAFIAIFIGCLGLYGLVAFMATQRTKEVGIRKVMGASVFNITVLFSKEFVKLVFIAFILAAPIAYYLMEAWLQGFSYRISISVLPFLLAGAATLLIALITMSSQAIQAALANPVLALKSE